MIDNIQLIHDNLEKKSRTVPDCPPGNVGIGTPTPTERLDLGGGNVKIGWSRHSRSSEAKDCYVNCPAGKVVVGGGCDNMDDTTPLIHNFPIRYDTWFCRWQAPNSNHCWAICANMK